MKVVEMNNYKSFDGAIPKQLTYRSLSHLAREFSFRILVGQALVDGIPLHQEVLIIDSSEYGECFFYEYNEYVNCFDLVREFKCCSGWENNEEFSILYDATFNDLASSHSISPELYIEVMASNEQAISHKVSFDDL